MRMLVLGIAVSMLAACASRPSKPLPPPPSPPPPIVQRLVAPPPPPPPTAAALPAAPVYAPVQPPAGQSMIVPAIPPPPPALSAGGAVVSQPTPMRARPIGSGIIEQNIPAGATLRLEVRQVTRDGAWWFVKYQGQTGWVSERGLTQE